MESPLYTFSIYISYLNENRREIFKRSASTQDIINELLDYIKEEPFFELDLHPDQINKTYELFKKLLDKYISKQYKDAVYKNIKDILEERNRQRNKRSLKFKYGVSI